jgi:hypothetical protein
LLAVAEAPRYLSCRRLGSNGAGAAGAALTDLGFPPELANDLALLAQAAGLVGHPAVERTRPIGMPLSRQIDGRIVYDGMQDADGAT